MHLHEVMGWEGPMTWRQYLSWQHWLDEQWNRPTRSDHYLGAVIAEVRRSYVKHPRQVKLEDCLLKFKERGKSESERPLTPAEQASYTARSKSFWCAVASTPGERPPKHSRIQHQQDSSKVDGG